MMQVYIPPPVEAPAPAPDAALLPLIRTYEAGPARCGGKAVAPLRRVDPVPDGLVVRGRAAAPAPLAIDFEIAADGRPVSLRVQPADPGTGDDVEPAFAAWRFPARRARQCTILFERRDTAVAEASPALLHLYLGTRASSLFRVSPAPVADAARARLRPAGSTCDPMPPVERWAWPAFATIPTAPGEFAWNYLAFDIGAGGRPVAIRLLGSSFNRELDRQSVDALGSVAFNRLATGCLYNYYRNPAEPMPPPPAPPSQPTACDRPAAPGAAPSGWVRLAPLVYPENFRRRSIEGWALVRYDVGPFGDTRGVRPVEAQPASGFGEAARVIVEQSLRSPGERTGCLELILFRMPTPEATAR